MIKKVTIYGERCSGTNYLEQLLLINFDVQVTWEFGWKHFFGFNDLTLSEDTLFICIVRNLSDWVNSLYREKHHLTSELTKNEHTFLNNEFYSVDEYGNEFMTDRNIYTKERYKNIFELRHIKNKFLIEDMPNLVQNYLLITYDDLLIHFMENMNKIKNKKLCVKNNIAFPVNILHTSLHKNIEYIKKSNQILEEKILDKANLYYEKMLF